MSNSSRGRGSAKRPVKGKPGWMAYFQVLGLMTIVGIFAWVGSCFITGFSTNPTEEESGSIFQGYGWDMTLGVFLGIQTLMVLISIGTWASMWQKDMPSVTSLTPFQREMHGYEDEDEDEMDDSSAR